MAIPLSYNIRHIVQRPISTLFTGWGIAMVVMILVGAFALASGFQATLVDTGSPDNAMILRTGADSEISSSLSRDAVNILRAHPAVAAGPDGRPLFSAEMLVLTNLERTGQSGSSNVPIRGVDPGSFGLRSDVLVVEGRMFTPGTGELIVGQRMARRFAGLRIGDSFPLGLQRFTIVGHFTAAGAAYESEIWGDPAVLQPALDREGSFQSVTFRMRDLAALPALRKELEGDPRLGVQVKTERVFYTEQSGLLGGFIRIAGLIVTLIMAVGAIFGAMNTMYAAVGQRTREIAVLLTLGFTPGAVMLSFMIESVLLALIGGTLGCLLALPVNGITTSTTNWASFSEVAFAFRVTPEGLMAGLAFAALMGLAGGFFPARRAAKQTLASSLRGV